MRDHNYVNFQEDHEMNYHLTKVNKRQTANNRTSLRAMGGSLKQVLGKTRLQHGEFHDYVSQNAYRLE